MEGDRRLACARRREVGGPGEQGLEVLRGSAAPGPGTEEVVEAEVVADLGDDLGAGAGDDVVVQGLHQLGRVKTLAELGMEVGLARVVGVVDRVLHAPDDVCAGFGALAAVCRGDVPGHEDGAADGAGDAVEAYRKVGGAVGAGCVRGGGKCLGVAASLGGDVLGDAGAELDQLVQGCAVELGVLVLLAGSILRLDTYIGL